jgi:hypothetical protein
MPAPYRFNVIVANAEIVFENAVTTDREYAINLYTVVDVTAQVKQVRVYGLADGAGPWLPTNESPWNSVANDATMLQDNWPDPASTFPSTLGPTADTQIASKISNYQQWFVRLHLNDQRFMDIPMGKVVNQENWKNDTVGANQCIQDILAEITMP